MFLIRLCILIILLACAGILHGQVPLPQSACNTPAALSSTTGTAALITNPGDRTILICSITVQITQGNTAASYQIQACRDSACTDAYPVTPLLPGHANLYDSYNLPPNPTAQIVLRKGYGLYLTLSGTATAVAQAIYGAY